MNELKPFHESIIDSIKSVFRNFRNRIMNPESNGNITPATASYCMLSELDTLINLLEKTIVPKEKLFWLEGELSAITTDFFSDEDSKCIDDSEFKKKLLYLNGLMAKR